MKPKASFNAIAPIPRCIHRFYRRKRAVPPPMVGAANRRVWMPSYREASHKTFHPCDAFVTGIRTRWGIRRELLSNRDSQNLRRKHSEAIQGYASEFILSAHNPLVQGSNPCGPTNLFNKLRQFRAPLASVRLQKVADLLQYPAYPPMQYLLLGPDVRRYRRSPVSSCAPSAPSHMQDWRRLGSDATHNCGATHDAGKSHAFIRESRQKNSRGKAARWVCPLRAASLQILEAGTVAFFLARSPGLPQFPSAFALGTI